MFRGSVLLIPLCYVLVTPAYGVRYKPNIKKINSDVTVEKTNLSKANSRVSDINRSISKQDKLLRIQSLEIEISKIELDSLVGRMHSTAKERDRLQQVIDLRKRHLKESLSHVMAFNYRTPVSVLLDRNTHNQKLRKQTVRELLAKENLYIQELGVLQTQINQLKNKTEEEAHQVEARVANLKEQKSILQLNRRLNQQQLRTSTTIQAKRLKSYKRARAKQRRVETTLSEIARKKRFRKFIARDAALHKGKSLFSAKGKLQLPAKGKIITTFGKKYDPKTNLYTFNKGIEIQTVGGAKVRAVYPGKVVFTGRLGGFRQLIIIDHGRQYYSLAGHLGETLKKVGDFVKKGEVIGKSDLNANPLYFEIRKRHIAVNPIPWFKNANKLTSKRST